MGMAKKGGLTLGYLHIGRNHRRRTLPCFLVTLLVIVSVPQIFYKAKQHAETIRQRSSIFGENLLPTPWHWHLTDYSSEEQSWERAWELLKCSYPGWSRRSHTLNTTESSGKCPDYFQWIRKDLSPWEHTGITAADIEMAQENAAFKVTILKGRLYVDMYYSCVQTRAPFTIWGMLLLLEKFEGKIPDVEILFDCMDRPRIRKQRHQPDGWIPAPLFRYCSNKWHHDIPWPDWSFWGWAETEIDPWDQEVKKIMKSSSRKAWRVKNPKAFWRGNPDVASPMRMELLRCNNATRYPKSEIVRQNWAADSHEEKFNSKLENQCNHRYKIYAEGYAWSVSFKYIMACGSPTLVISPKYHDFFMRGLIPSVHYVPVRPADICANRLCTALDWGVRTGEQDELKAINIGEAGFKFLQEEVSMARVYDYMYHMLRSYAALQRFKPALSPTSREVTQSFVLCASKPHERSLLEKSKQEVPWSTPPCSLNFNEGSEHGPRNFLWEDDVHADDGWSTRDCSAVRLEDPWKPKPRKRRPRDKSKVPKQPIESANTDPAKIDAASQTRNDDRASDRPQPTEVHPAGSKSQHSQPSSIERNAIPIQEQSVPTDDHEIPVSQNSGQDSQQKTMEAHPHSENRSQGLPEAKETSGQKSSPLESNPDLKNEAAKDDDRKNLRNENPVISEPGANAETNAQVAQKEKRVNGEMMKPSDSTAETGEEGVRQVMKLN